MKVTIQLDEDLHDMVHRHAVAMKTSLAQAVADLLRRGAPPKLPARSRPAKLHPESGFPVSACGSDAFTEEDLQRALDDETIHELELAGASTELRKFGTES